MTTDEADYRQLRADAYRLIYRQVRDHSAAEDIVQDSFMRLSRHKDRVANIGAMIRVIAGNLIRDRARGQRRSVEKPWEDGIDAAIDEPSAEAVLIHRERVEQVQAILQEMPAVRREIFLRRRLHGQSSREVAAAVGISPAAVDMHVARAVLALHASMADIARREDAA